MTREVFTWLPAEILAGGEARFLTEAREEEVYVAAESGRILGLACLYRPEHFLHSLYLEADARGRGIGRALFNHVRGEAAGPISLKVQKLNGTAIAFYRAQGMTVVGEGDLDAPGGGWFRMADPPKVR